MVTKPAAPWARWTRYTRGWGSGSAQRRLATATPPPPPGWLFDEAAEEAPGPDALLLLLLLPLPPVLVKAEALFWLSEGPSKPPTLGGTGAPAEEEALGSMGAETSG